MSPAEAASALEAALYAENDRLHKGEAKWSSATATALLQAKTYAHRVRRFLGVGAVAEARRAFDAIGWPALHDVFDANADLAVAAAAVRELLAE
jgi:hypothetical protein